MTSTASSAPPPRRLGGDDQSSHAQSASSQTFSKRFRLSLQNDFRRVFRKGRRFEADWAVVLAAPNGLGHGRLGIVVTRKLGKAVLRNRMKRLIREWFRKGMKQTPFDLVVRPRPTLSTLDSVEKVAHAFDQLLAPLKVRP